MQLLEKNRIVNILASIVTLMLVLMQMITIPDHPVIYNFLTWLTWPSLFFIAGYYMTNKEGKASILHIIRCYLLPYIITGVLIVVVNKIMQVLHLAGEWVKIPFPSMKIGAVTMLYGNGWPTDTLIGHHDFGIGLLWILLALLFGVCIQLMIDKLRIQIVKVIISLVLMVLGFYLGTKVQLPWSLDAALIMQLYILLGKYFKTVVITNISAPVTIGVGMLTVWLMSISSGPFELTLATTRYWFWGTITALLGLIMLILIANYLTKLLSNPLYDYFVKLGDKQSINIAVLAFVNLMFPIAHYVSVIIKLPHGTFVIIWLVMVIIVFVVKLMIQYMGQRYFSWSSNEGIS